MNPPYARTHGKVAEEVVEVVLIGCMYGAHPRA
jgi:hypothetical protein